jgi:hypothetical protein
MRKFALVHHPNAPDEYLLVYQDDDLLSWWVHSGPFNLVTALEICHMHTVCELNAFHIQGRPMFHFSSYWHTWSRVLSQEDGVTVELNLTPVNPQWDRSWKEMVETTWIRRHRTAPGEGDQLVDYLPGEVMKQVRKHLTEEFAAWLIRTDFLPLIDWEKYEQHNNGGAPLHKILKPLEVR